MIAHEPDDAELVERTRSGDLEAFETLVRQHIPRVYRVAVRMLGSAAEAEDATQETFLSAWRALHEFRADSAFSTWLYRIVVNQCLKMLRTCAPIRPLPEELAATQPGPQQLVERDQLLSALRAAIGQLTPPQRAVFVLRHLEGCSYQQVADALGISLSAVKSRLHRAHQQIIDDLRGWR